MEVEINKLEQDLFTTGFGTELKVRDLLSKIVFEDDKCPVYRIESGGCYQDLDSGKSREYDLKAYRELALDGLSYSPFEHILFCEVKKCYKPWLVFKDRQVKYANPSAWFLDRSKSDVHDVLRATGATLSYPMGWIGSGMHDEYYDNQK